MKQSVRLRSVFLYAATAIAVGAAVAAAYQDHWDKVKADSAAAAAKQDSMSYFPTDANGMPVTGDENDCYPCDSGAKKPGALTPRV